jgi:RES domain-containing protein
VTIQKYIKPWKGFGVRHIPANRIKNGKEIENDPLDFRYCGKGNNNRWNSIGESTLYLAMERDVALVEWGRHLTINRSSGLKNKLKKRNVFLLDLELEYTLDLRDKKVWKTLSLSNAPDCFNNIKTAQVIASYLRNITKLQALFVPSIGFQDDLTKWCLVIFLDKLDEPLSKYFVGITKDNPFEA